MPSKILHFLHKSSAKCHHQLHHSVVCKQERHSTSLEQPSHLDRTFPPTGASGGPTISSKQQYSPPEQAVDTAPLWEELQEDHTTRKPFLPTSRYTPEQLSKRHCAPLKWIKVCTDQNEPFIPYNVTGSRAKNGPLGFHRNAVIERKTNTQLCLSLCKHYFLEKKGLSLNGKRQNGKLLTTLKEKKSSF